MCEGVGVCIRERERERERKRGLIIYNVIDAKK